MKITKRQKRNHLFIGIDCGLGGGIVALNYWGEIKEKHRIPIISDGTRNVLDIEELGKLLDSIAGHCVFPILAIEDPGGHAPSASALRSLTYCYAALVSYATFRGYKRFSYRALEWQRRFWTKPKLLKGEKFDTKGAALATVRRLWPDESYLATARSRKAHDGLVDACLIAEHCRQEFQAKASADEVCYYYRPLKTID